MKRLVLFCFVLFLLVGCNLEEVVDNKPIANAGDDISVKVGSFVQLDGNESRSKNDEPLTFEWRFVSMPVDSSATLSGKGGVEPSFIADAPGIYRVALIVSDSAGQSNQDRVIVTATDIDDNAKPIADAGSNQQVTVGAVVELSAENSSDADGDELTYQWRFKSLPQASSSVFNNANEMNASFTADVAGTYIVLLTISDGLSEDSMEIEVVAIDSALPEMSELAKNSGCHACHDVAKKVVGPAWSDVANRYFNGKSRREQLRNKTQLIQKIKEGGKGNWSEITKGVPMPPYSPRVTDENIVNLVEFIMSLEGGLQPSRQPSENSPPVADAGEDGEAQVGDAVQLDGFGSYDDDGEMLSFNWKFTSKPVISNAVLYNATMAAPYFIADVAGDYTISLNVSDGSESDDDAVNIKVHGDDGTPSGGANDIPVADAGADVIADLGETVKLSGINSYDKDSSDVLTYLWKLIAVPEGSSVSLEGSESQMIVTVTPDVAGYYQLALVVNDGTDESDEDIVTVQTTGFVPNEMPPLAKKSGCSACHAISKKVVGPAWLDVAKHYSGDVTARDALINKVKKGGRGNWTEVTHGVPMPPYSPRVNDEDITWLVDFILGMNVPEVK